MGHRSTFLAFLFAAGLASVAGCGDQGGVVLPDDVGAAAVVRNGCTGCHGGARGALAGSDAPVEGTLTYGPNLTPDRETGLGDWSDEQIIRAIRMGLDDEGSALCTSMPRFMEMPGDEARAVVAHLRSLDAVRHMTRRGVCDGDDEARSALDASTPDDAPPFEPEVPLDAGSLEAGSDTTTDLPQRDGGRDATRDSEARALDVAHEATDQRLDVVTSARADVRVDIASEVAPDAAPLGCHPVINEVLTGARDRGTYEWVELYNPCAVAISLTGWRLGYRSAARTSAITAADTTTLFAFASQTIAPRGYLLLANAGYTGMADARITGGMADAGGGVGLRDLAGTIVDSMAWGTATNAFVRVHAAPAAPSAAIPGRSLQRMPDGADTQSNASDFHFTTQPTPRAPNA